MFHFILYTARMTNANRNVTGSFALLRMTNAPLHSQYREAQSTLAQPQLHQLFGFAFGVLSV